MSLTTTILIVIGVFGIMKLYYSLHDWYYDPTRWKAEGKWEEFYFKYLSTRR